MEKALKIILPIAVLVLSYFLYESVASRVRYEKEVQRVEEKVINRLKDIKTAQMVYKEIHGVFAPNFEVLISAIKTEKIPLIKQEGELIDSTSVVKMDTTYVSIIGPEGRFPEGFVVDSLPFVPLSDKVQFTINAGFVDKNGVKVPVFLVEDPKPFNKKRALRVGSMDEPVYSGNWE